ncbi:MAG TPA: hypothetical protein PLU84_06315, partial [Enterococcus aquimarinus]|nr:hypothetical protein [Enterococcus aquimarinus]
MRTMKTVLACFLSMV